VNFLALVTLLLPLIAYGEKPSADRSEQIAKIAKLVRDTERRDSQLKAELQQLEQQLTEAYADFDLDEEHIKEIQEKIADAQKELLVNYHQLQMGIRSIMGKQDFVKIKARIDNYLSLKTVKERQQEPEKPPSAIPVQPR
jgi:hypothetical protein